MGERLFHTLDPTTRAYRHRGPPLPGDRHGRLHPQAPHQLVEAFKATLEETVLADLIVHVVDASEPEDARREAIAAVDSVLEEIGAGSAPAFSSSTRSTCWTPPMPMSSPSASPAR